MGSTSLRIPHSRHDDRNTHCSRRTATGMSLAVAVCLVLGIVLGSYLTRESDTQAPSRRRVVSTSGSCTT